MLKATFQYQEIPKFPEVKRNFAFLLDEHVSYCNNLTDLSFNPERSLLLQIELFDVQQGNQLGAGKKSYAVSFNIN